MSILLRVIRDHGVVKKRFHPLFSTHVCNWNDIFDRRFCSGHRFELLPFDIPPLSPWVHSNAKIIFYPNFSSFSFNLMLIFLLVSYFNVFLLIYTARHSCLLTQRHQSINLPAHDADLIDTDYAALNILNT